jgi:predicted transcriptional regulator of viral defense system
MINIDEEDRRELYFKYMKPLPKNEMYWYSDPKESNEERVLAAVMTDGHNFSTTAFASALESVMKLSSNNAVYGWLKRLEDQGLIRKIDHGNYRKIVTELDDFLD